MTNSTDRTDVITSEYSSPYPEHVPVEPASYPMLDDRDSEPKYPYAYDSKAPPSAVPPPTDTARRPPPWRRWSLLFLLSVLLAVIAGLIGGFIGKTIESHSHGSRATPSSATPTACPTSTNNTSSSELNIPVPDTGCSSDDKTTNGQTFLTDTAHVNYTLYCNVDYVGNDLIAILAPTISDCMEACETLNTINATKSANLECRGAAFVPAWVNKTLAMAGVSQPANCFLKYALSSASTPRESVLTVGLCLTGFCSN